MPRESRAPLDHRPSANPTRRAYWLREALADEPGEPCPPLVGHERAEVLIIGGGFTGMWTAWFLTEQEPGLDVAVLEQDVCGGGPTGRNGGFATGWWDELPGLVELYGRDEALTACRAVADSVRAIGEWSRANAVDAWYTPAGYLMAACSEAQEGAWRGATKLAAELGVGAEYVEQSQQEVRARCDSPVFRSGVFMRGAATVQPARLARGLRRVLLERGVRIHEGSAVRRFRAGLPARAETPRGSVTAERAVVATGAWAAGWPAFARRLATWTSHIVLTAPAPERLAEIGWTGGECITDARTAVQYFRTTPDGRIAFGGGGGRVANAKRITRKFHDDPISIERSASGFRRLFPSFADIPLADAWGGPIDVSPSHLPFFGTAATGNVHYGIGYTGNGVAPSHVGGRILAGLALGRDDDATRLPMVDPQPRPVRFPPEPMRTLGAHLVREAVVRKEQADDAGRRPSRFVREVARLPRRLGYHLGPE